VGGVRVLTPAARILLALARSGRGLSFRQLSLAAGIPDSVLDRNLKALLAEGLVLREGRLYTITPKGRAVVQALKSEVEGV